MLQQLHRSDKKSERKKSQDILTIGFCYKIFNIFVFYAFGWSWEIRWVDWTVKSQIDEGSCVYVCFRCECQGVRWKNSFILGCEGETNIHRIRLLVVCEVQREISRISDIHLLAVVHCVGLEYTCVDRCDWVREWIKYEFQGGFCWPSKLWSHFVCVIHRSSCPRAWENEFICCPGTCYLLWSWQCQGNRFF